VVSQRSGTIRHVSERNAILIGDGVIGNTTGSGPVIGGSSPPPRTKMRPLL
jgi:hypothetical protein